VEGAFGLSGNIFSDDGLSGVMSGQSHSRKVVASESMVLTLLKQSAAIITASGDKSRVKAYENTYRAIAAKIKANHVSSSSVASAARAGSGRQLQTNDVISFFTSYEALTAIITAAASLANVTADETLVMIAANMSAAVMEATTAMLVANTSDAAQPSTDAFFTSLMQLNIADEQLAARSAILAQGIYNGSISVEEVELQIQATNGASVVALSHLQPANGASYLQFACGDPSATNYAPGGNNTAACRYASPPPSPPPPVNNTAFTTYMEIGGAIITVIMVALFIGFLVFCGFEKRQSRAKNSEILRQRSIQITAEGIKNRALKRGGEVTPSGGLIEPSTERSDALTMWTHRSGAKVADDI